MVAGVGLCSWLVLLLGWNMMLGGCWCRTWLCPTPFRGWRQGQAWAQLSCSLRHGGFPVLPTSDGICPTAVASKLEVFMPAVVEVESGGTARIECNFYIPGNGSYTYINWSYVSAGPQGSQWVVGWGGS